MKRSILENQFAMTLRERYAGFAADPWTRSQVQNVERECDRIAALLSEAEQLKAKAAVEILRPRHVAISTAWAAFGPAVERVNEAKRVFYLVVDELEAATGADAFGTIDTKESDAIALRLKRADHALKQRMRELADAQTTALAHLHTADSGTYDADRAKAEDRTASIVEAHETGGKRGISPAQGADEASAREVAWWELYEARALQGRRGEDRRGLARLFEMRREARQNAIDTRRSELARLEAP